MEFVSSIAANAAKNYDCRPKTNTVNILLWELKHCDNEQEQK